MRSYGTAVVSLALSVFAVAQVARPQSTIVPARLRPGNPGPKFPKKAQEEFVAGPVVFRANVTPKGRVDDVAVLQVPMADLGFEKATEDAVKQWRFEPATLDGEPVAGTYVGTVDFAIDATVESSLREIVAAVVRHATSHDVEALSRLFDEELGHAHSSEGIVRGPLEAASHFIEVGVSATDAASLDRFQYYRDDFVHVSASHGPERQFELYATRRGESWTLAHLTLEPRWRELERSRFEVPRKTKERAPAYPREAKTASIAGRVVVEAVTDRNGEVSDVVEIAALPFLSTSLATTMKKWRYRPVKLDGESLSLYTVVIGDYKLTRGDWTINLKELVGASDR